jgi:hypothetical protein
MCRVLENRCIEGRAGEIAPVKVFHAESVAAFMLNVSRQYAESVAISTLNVSRIHIDNIPLGIPDSLPTGSSGLNGFRFAQSGLCHSTYVLPASTATQVGFRFASPNR